MQLLHLQLKVNVISKNVLDQNSEHDFTDTIQKCTHSIKPTETHSVFDYQFTSVSANTDTLPSVHSDSLYSKAQWLQKDTFATAMDLFHFGTYWADQ